MILAAALLAAAATLPPELAAYERALHRVEARRERASIEPLFDAANALGGVLLAQAKDDEPGTLLEAFSAADYAAVEKRARGLDIWREEIVSATPNPKFFLDLARRRGVAADVAFFETFLRGQIDGWPAYFDLQTDVSGCTRFGAGELVKGYRRWRAFRAKYPHAYRDAVAEELGAIEREVTRSDCACGGKEEVLRELREFANAFPTSPVVDDVRRRADALRRGTSDIRFNCGW